MLRVILPLFIALIVAGTATADIRRDVQALFEQDMNAIDFAITKLKVDRLIDPNIDMEVQLSQIDQMVASIEQMLPKDANSWTKINAIQRYIYQPGPWNEGRAFVYDHEDPYGLDIRNKLLSDYIQDRQGNCITMPFLFIILGQKMGLNVTPSVAPLHVFVKFTDDDGNTHNLEATSGAGRTRDSHYQRLLQITDKAILNDVYLSPLDKKQSVAVIAAVIVEELIRQRRYQEAMDVADILLEHYPQFVYVMVKKGTAAYHLLRTEFYEKYPNPKDVPQQKRALLARLQHINQATFSTAESLGWQPLQ